MKKSKTKAEQQQPPKKTVQKPVKNQGTTADTTKSAPKSPTPTKSKTTASSAKPSRPEGIKVDVHNNRLSRALETNNFRSKTALQEIVKNTDFQAVELAPAFRSAFQRSEKYGERLAEVYAQTIPNLEQHRELFQQVAQLDTPERAALIKGYRKAGQSRGIVHAISQLPRAYGRTIMRDFVIKEDGSTDKNAVQDVLFWLRDAGAEMRKMEQNPRRARRPQDEEMDDAVVEFFEDVVDAIGDAVTAVVDAIGDTLESLGNAIVEVVNWAADAVASLVHALITAGQTIANLLEAALMTGYELVKKMIQGLEAIGKAMFEVLEAAVNFAKEAFVTILRAIDNLGRQLIEFVSWLANKTFDIIKKAVEALIEIGKSIGNILEKALQFGLTLVRSFVQALIEIGRTVAEILIVAITRPGDLFDTIVRSVMDLGRNLRSIFDEVVNAGADLIREVARAAARIGTVIVEFTSYIATAAIEIATKVLQGILEAGRTLVEVIQSIATQAIAAVRKVVDAFFRLGRTLVNLFKECFTLAMNLLREVVRAAIELGKTIIEITRTLVEFTYRTAARFIEAALEVGVTVVEMLETVVESTYFVFRKIVNGILQALGPVGDVFEWLLERGEALGSALWREAVMACRFVKRSVTEILDWGASQIDATFESIIRLVESAGAAVTEVIDWAIAVGEEMLEQVAGIWERVGNSIIYALNYLEKDFIPGIAKFIKGAMDAGFEFARLVAWVATKTVEVMTEALRGMLEAGVIMADLIVETALHPDQFMNNLMEAARRLEQTMSSLVDAVKQAGEEFVDEFVRAMVAIGEDLVEMLEGFLEVFAGMLDTVIFILMEMLNSFRRLTDAERADATLVFGASIDLDKVYIATESPTNSIIFGIQDFASGNPDSRAFVSGNLINIDADDDTWDRPTLIHELTHVWQNQNEGPIYMAHAVFAQVAGEGYNYGYTEGGSIDIPNGRFDGNPVEDVDEGKMVGIGGEAALIAENGNFNAFNPEQQGQITMHYFVRRHLLNQTPAEYAAWQPYIDFVQNNRPVRA
jgi:phage-related protein